MLVQGSVATGEKWRDNWITPKDILDRVYATFNRGWLDPCPSDPGFDGLSISWHEKDPAYINPPFSEYQKWVDYGMAQKCTQLWLANSNTETKYYQTLLEHSRVVLFPNKRISFIDPRTGEKGSSPRQGQTFFLVGADNYTVRRFLDNFKDMGQWVIKENTNEPTK